jgi:hypothetical protein
MNIQPNIDSSETTREALVFQFSEYQKVKPSHITTINIPFFEWFIGFTEGDGSFIVKNSTVSRNCKQLVFTIYQNDVKLLHKIKTTLGFGTVTQVKNSNKHAYRYNVFRVKDIVKLIHLFNGNLVLEKIWNRFEIWVNEYNKQCNMGSTSWKPIALKPYRKQCTLQSAWLAGFVEADGGFYANLRNHAKSKNGYALVFKFYITQKYEKPILESIAHLFRDQTKTKLSKSNSSLSDFIYTYKSKIETYRLELTKYQDIHAIIAYFERYPLQGKKNIVFVRWKRLFISKDRLKQEAWISEKSFQKLNTLVKAVQNTKL